jgi:UDPglucose 6-dehydrogenase
MKISVIGMGYVGLSNAILLAVKHSVICHDSNLSKLDSINKKVSPIKDALINSYLKNKPLKLSTSIDVNEETIKSSFIIISTPTNYDPLKNTFDTSSIDSILLKLNKLKCNASIIIKSTLPIGYTDSANQKFKNLKIYFSPEFLREGKALYDNLYPSRIIIGNTDKYSKRFLSILKSSSLNKDVKTFTMTSSEAESVKLFANSYLAMRVAYFNELDSFASCHHLDSKQLIDGICADPRIGDGYNNPSFGFGGYCLPKDTLQLSSSFNNVPNAIVKSLKKSNQLRKKHVVDDILKSRVKRIGIYLLSMKKDSDNFRESSIIDVIKLLKKNGKTIYIYEPLLGKKKNIFGCTVINDFNSFLNKTGLIVTNRLCKELRKVRNKVYTRDIYGEN